jgi:nitrogen fixation protein NifU and related proteins
VSEGLDGLYQELILDHQKHPRNFGELEGANRRAEGHNPLCGDAITVTLLLDASDVIRDLQFTGSGCAISRASASLMTEALKGKTRDEAMAMFGMFHDLVTGNVEPAAVSERLGKLRVFEGVREFPVRVKCASLAWHTLKAAIEGSNPGIVSTESGS